MNKSQKTLHDLMLEILPFEEFRQNDICEFDAKHEKSSVTLKLQRQIMICGTETALMIDGLTLSIKGLKFISRDWQLPDLLMAMNKENNDVTLISDRFFIDNHKMKITCNNLDKNFIIEFDFDLTKPVLEQESIKQIIEVLK